MTNEERAALIAFSKDKIFTLKLAVKQRAFENLRDELQLELQIAEIALASLEAKHAISIEVIQKNERLRGFNFDGYDELPAGLHKFYTAPPVAVMQPVVLPSGFAPSVISHGSQSTRYKAIMTGCGDWIHRDQAAEAIRAAGGSVKE